MDTRSGPKLDARRRPRAVRPARGAGRARWLLGVPLLALFVSCASTRGEQPVSARIVLRQFGSSAVVMELRSESHTPAVEFYSTPRRDPNVKIFSDEEMSGLLEGLDESGFARFAAPGPGPRSGADGVTKVIEVERQGAVQHLASHPNASDDQRRLVSELTVGLAQVFNAKRAFQQIDDDRGGAIFLGPSAGGTP